MIKLQIRFGYFLNLAVLLAAMLCACQSGVARTSSTTFPTQIPTITAVVEISTLKPATATPTPVNTVIFTSKSPTPTHTSTYATKTLIPTLTKTRPTKPPTPTRTFTPTPELLTCPESMPQADTTRPVKILYSNEDSVWLWDEANEENIQIPLPTDATALQISEDGRFIAFLEQGQAYDTPEKAVQSIPLWLFDRQNGKSREITSFLTTEIRKLYPEAPQILLKMEWLPAGHWLIAQVYPVPWGEGFLQPTGDLFLINADTGASQRLLPGGAYEYFNIVPDGRQIAALDTAAISEDGTWDEFAVQNGTLYLIDIPPRNAARKIPVRLTRSTWTISSPSYSPDGGFISFQVEGGLTVIDSKTGSVQTVAIDNPCEKNGCYEGGQLSVIWLPNSQSFYTLTSENDYFDVRAETELLLVRMGPELTTEIAQVIHASPFTFLFSDDRRILSFWNQPDLDTGEKDLNWVSLYLLDLQNAQPRHYTSRFVLRVHAWSPDNQHFLYTYSPFGGANPVTNRLALGNVCQPPRELSVPENRLIEQVQWIDDKRFLAWTVPADGIPTRYTAGLYLYSLTVDGQPIHIVDLVSDYDKPYGMQSQVVVLEK